VKEQAEKEEEEEVEEEVYEEVVEEVEIPRVPITTQIVQTAPRVWAVGAVRNTVYFAGFVLAATLLFSTFKVVKKKFSPRGKRKNTVNKNKFLVDKVGEMLRSPTGLTREDVQRVKRDTGFTLELVFRKYLRYLLDQRPFDPQAVKDVLTLRQRCMLTDDQVVLVFEESARRTFDRTGILMVKPSGLTAAGLQKKAAGRATFSKLMYLADLDQLLPEEKGKDLQTKIKDIFGATEEDTEELRISTLSEGDTVALEALMGRTEGESGGSLEVEGSQDESEGEQGSESSQPPSPSS